MGTACSMLLSAMGKYEESHAKQTEGSISLCSKEKEVKKLKA